MLEASIMMIKLTLDLTLPDDANALEVVYLLKAAREIASTIWPEAKLRSRQVVIPCKKKSGSSVPTKPDTALTLDRLLLLPSVFGEPGGRPSR
jgi:hypothetical protein